MRLTQATVERLNVEIKRLTGRAAVESICRPGDGRTHYVMAGSMTSAYYGAREATAYLLGVLAGLDPQGQAHYTETRAQWLTDIDHEYRFGLIPAAQLAAHEAGVHYGRTLRAR